MMGIKDIINSQVRMQASETVDPEKELIEQTQREQFRQWKENEITRNIIKLITDYRKKHIEIATNEACVPTFDDKQIRIRMIQTATIDFVLNILETGKE